MNKVPLDVRVIQNYFPDLREVQDFAKFTLRNYNPKGGLIDDLPLFIKSAFNRHIGDVRLSCHNLRRQVHKDFPNLHVDGNLPNAYALVVPISPNALGTMFLDGQAPGTNVGAVFSQNKIHWEPPQKGRIVYLSRFLIC